MYGGGDGRGQRVLERTSQFSIRVEIVSLTCEVAMSARRRDSRLEMLNADGVLQVMRDVMVRRIEGRDYLAISSEAGRKGEVLTIYIASHGNQPVAVRVVDSHPTIVDGSVRHQIRLRALDGEALGSGVTTTSSGDSEAE
jgi:hypothetical protein